MTVSTPTPTPTTAAPGTRRRVGALVGGSGRVLVVGALVIALMLFFNAHSGGAFLSERNISILLRQATVTGIAAMAMAMAMAMIMREIDLSFGSSTYLCAVALAITYRNFHGDMFTMILAALLVGIVLGVWQAFWVVVMRVPAFVATLGGFLGFRAIGLVITNASPISVSESFSNLSESLLPAALSLVALALIALGVIVAMARSGRGRIGAAQASPILVALVMLGVLAWLGSSGGIPTSAIWLAVVGLVMYVYLGRTRIGRNNFVVGANRDAARLSGINSKRLLFGAFVLMGVFYAICAILSTSRLGSVGPQLGNGLELDAIAAAVIGGVSLTGGRGSVLGALGGALLLATIDNGLNFMDQIDANYQPLIKALILLAAVGIDMRLQRQRG